VTAGLSGLCALQLTTILCWQAISSGTDELLVVDSSNGLFGLSWPLGNDDSRHPRASRLKFLRDRVVC
jgi:hypothetical protein